MENSQPVNWIPRSQRWLAGLLVSAFLLGTFAASRPLPTTAAEPEFAVPNGYFYTQAAGDGGASGRGFAITDDGGVPFWSTFQQLGGVQALGYPASQRFTLGGFTVQATQRVILQWQP